MNENKFSLSLSPGQAEGRKAEVTLPQEGGLPIFKVAAPSPLPSPRRSARVRASARLKLAAQQPDAAGGLTGDPRGLPACTRAHTAFAVLRVKLLRGKPAVGTSQEAPRNPPGTPQSFLEPIFREEGSSERAARATAPPLQENGGGRHCPNVLRSGGRSCPRFPSPECPARGRRRTRGAPASHTCCAERAPPARPDRPPDTHLG